MKNPWPQLPANAPRVLPEDCSIIEAFNARYVDDPDFAIQPRPLPTGRPSRRAPNSRSPWRTRSTGGTVLTHAPRPPEPGHGVGVDPAEECLADDEPVAEHADRGGRDAEEPFDSGSRSRSSSCWMASEDAEEPTRTWRATRVDQLAGLGTGSRCRRSRSGVHRPGGSGGTRPENAGAGRASGPEDLARRARPRGCARRSGRARPRRPG